MIKAPQALSRAGLHGEFRFQPLCDAFETALAHIAQNSVFAGKIPEESWLADFEDFDDIVDTGLFVTLFSEQADGGFDNLLPQSRFLAFAQPRNLLLQRASPRQAAMVSWSTGRGNLNTGHTILLYEFLCMERFVQSQWHRW